MNFMLTRGMSFKKKSYVGARVGQPGIGGRFSEVLFVKTRAV